MDVGSENLFRERLDAKNVKPFILKEGIMYRVGQDNIMHRYLTTSKP